MGASAVAAVRATVEPVQAPKSEPKVQKLSSDAEASDAAIGAQVSRKGPAEAAIRARVREAHEPRDTSEALAKDSARPDHHERAKARDGAGAAEIHEDASTRAEQQLTKSADRADRVFAKLVQQRDIIRRSTEFGDTQAAHQAFGRARELFAQLIAIGNDAQINVSSSTDSEVTKEAKQRIADRVKSAYEWAALIEEAMPGDQTV